uniref:RNase H type-1 domain-containing protein n=1 Tax=Heliothis virescens TaxID=7102 RepID=A0A2A4JIV0_HELVI
MFTLRVWVTNFNVKELIVSNLDCVTKSKRSYANSSLNQSIIDELHLKYKDWYPIFTDGAKNADGQGAAFYVPNTPTTPQHNNCFKIKEKVCIMTLELVAISEALSYVCNAGVHRKVVILTDSKSSLQHIARCASGSRGASIAYVILCKMDELAERGVLLRLQWVPSHTGLRGNEEADTLAKFATISGRQINIVPDYSEFMPTYKQVCFENWKEYFNKRSLEKGIWYKTIQCQPLHIPWCANTELNRRLTVTAHRLRSGHIPCNKFSFMMRKTESPNCDNCGICEDVYHLLLECVRFEAGRSWIANAFKLNRLDVGTYNSILSQPNSKVAKSLFELMASK